MRHKPRGQVTVTLGDSEDREVEVTAIYHASTPAYFSRSWGNWLPGDEEDIEVLDAKALDIGADVEAVARGQPSGGSDPPRKAAGGRATIPVVSQTGGRHARRRGPHHHLGSRDG
jgi:hypothetical protein